MKKYLTKFLFLSFVILAVSCNEAVKPNPIFEQALPDSKPYKDELAKQLKLVDNSKLTYYFDSYEQKEGKEYLKTTIEGEGLDASVLIFVKNWDEAILPIKESKGKGYGGGQLVNLKFEVVKDSTATEFVYVSVDEIVD